MDRPGYRLTKDAEELYDCFTSEYWNRGCECWTGCAPCGWCTHEGNPHNLRESEEYWMKEFDLEMMCLEAYIEIDRTIEHSVRMAIMRTDIDFAVSRALQELRMKKMYADFGVEG